MNNTKSSSWTDLADDYNQIYCWNREHEFFYYSCIIDPKDSVLEIGSGTGDLMQHIKENCSEVVGIDNSDTMIEIAKARFPDVELHKANMCDFNLNRKFDKVIVGFNNIQLLQTDEECLQALNCFKNHCNENGRIILDLLDLDVDCIEDKSEGRYLSQKTTPSGKIQIFKEDSNFDRKNRVLEAVWKKIDKDSGEVIATGSHLTKFYTKQYLIDLAEKAGLESLKIESRYSKWTSSQKQIHFFRPKQ